MRPMAWLFSAVLVVGLLGALSPASPAAAAGPVTTTTLSSATNIAPGDKVTVLERSFTLAAGESRHLRARIDTTSSTDAVVALTLSITCVDASGAEVDKGRATARNHEGRNAPYKIPGRLPIYADALLTAPAAGSYTCAMQAWTASNATSDYHLTAVAGDTWLQSSDTDQVGAYQWTNPACDSQGTLASCTYLGAGSDREWLFYSDGTPRHVWTARSSATAVDVAASYTLTTCPQGTASCQNAAIAPYQKPRGIVTVVDATLQLIQLDATGHTCHTTTVTTTGRITDGAHHYAYTQSLSSVPIRSDCGSRDFLVRVQLDHVSGQPVKIDGQQSVALSTAIIKNR